MLSLEVCFDSLVGRHSQNFIYLLVYAPFAHDCVGMVVSPRSHVSHNAVAGYHILILSEPKHVFLFYVDKNEQLVKLKRE